MSYNSSPPSRLSLFLFPLSAYVSPPSSHIPRMLRAGGDKVSTAEVTTRCNRYPSPPPPPDAIPALSLLSGRVSVGC